MIFAASAGAVGDARSKIGGGKISDARFVLLFFLDGEDDCFFSTSKRCAGCKGKRTGCQAKAREDEEP